MFICEAFFVLFGLYALVTGRIRLIGKRSVVGSRARMIGLILLTPVAFAFFGGVIIGLLQGGSFRTSEVQNVVVLELAAMIVAIIAALVIASNTPETPVGVSADASGSLMTYAAPRLPDVLTPAEAAAYLRVSEADIAQLIETGQITARLIGQEYRISKTSLDAFLNKT